RTSFIPDRKVAPDSAVRRSRAAPVHALRMPGRDLGSWRRGESLSTRPLRYPRAREGAFACRARAGNGDVLETARADFREWSAVREICRRGCRIEERAEASSPRAREGIKTRLHERRLRCAAK